MTGIRRLSILGLMVLGVLATSAGVALAQVAPGRLSPALTAGVRFDPAPVAVRDGTSRFSVRTADLKIGESTVQGSQNRGQGIGFGVEAGIARHKLTSEGESDSGTGTMFGVWVGGNKGGRVGFTGEFLYVIRKIKDESTGDELKYNALQIPAVFHVNFGTGGPEDPMVYAIVGPVFTINLKQKLNDIDISEAFNGADIGVLVGGGVEILRFALEVRYNIGLRNISSEGDFGNIKSRALEFVVKFRISGS